MPIIIVKIIIERRRLKRSKIETDMKQSQLKAKLRSELERQPFLPDSSVDKADNSNLKGKDE